MWAVFISISEFFETHKSGDLHTHNGGDLYNLVHHSYRGIQYFSIRYSERLGEVEMSRRSDSRRLPTSMLWLRVPVVLTRLELIHRQGLWCDVEHVECTALNYVNWFNSHGFSMKPGRIQTRPENIKRSDEHFDKMWESTSDDQSGRVLDMPTVFKEPHNSITFAKIQYEIIWRTARNLPRE